MDRREFATLLPALLACSALTPQGAEAQKTLTVIESGVYKPTPPKAGGQQGHTSSHYLAGLLKAGNIRLEIHESTIQPGAPHEAIGTHLHNEIWVVREGTADLMANGVIRKMVAGDVGIVVAGDTHYIANGGDTPLSYVVLAVGPPE